jgi:acylphosphatase
MSTERRVHVVVTGRVQGVFFRTTCARRASDLDVAGWVRNRSDGAVEATFEGDAVAVEELLAWCRQGPPGAAVTDVDVLDEAPTGELGFRVMG